MKTNVLRRSLAALCGALLATTAATSQPRISRTTIKSPTISRTTISGLTKYGTVLQRILQRSSGVSTTQRTLASAQNSQGKAELLIGASPDRSAEPLGQASATTGSTVICQSRPFRLDFTTVGSFDVFRVDESKLYPGAIVTPQSVLNLGFADVANLPTRRPLTLTVDLLGPNSRADAVTVNAPINNVSVNNAIKALVRGNAGATIPTQSAASAQAFRASAELAAEISSSAGALVPLAELGIPGSADLERSGGASASASGTIDRYTVSLFEPMYTVSVGESGGTLFENAATVSGVEGVMVNSVTYGRLLFLYIEGIGGAAKLSAFFRNKLGLELLVEGSPVGVSADNEASASASAEFQILTMKATIIGGSSTQGNALTSAILTGEDARQKLQAYLTARSASTLSAATAARPIAYTMVYVKNNASMGVRFVADSDILFDCRAARKLRVEMLSVKATKVVDNPAGAGGDNEDLFGHITAEIDGAQIIEGPRSRKLFDYTASAPLRLRQGQSVAIAKSFESVIDPSSLERFSVRFTESLTDHFDDAEKAVNALNRKTSASYEITGGTNLFNASDLNLLRSPNGITRTVKLQESGGESTVEALVKFSFVD